MLPTKTFIIVNKFFNNIIFISTFFLSK